MLARLDLTPLDLVAVVFFLLAWVTHFWVVNRSPWRTRTISHHMAGRRAEWMQRLVRRQGAPTDALIQNGLQQGQLFFASTSVLLIGGLAAGLGASESAVAVLSDLPFGETRSRVQWEVKLLLVIVVFVFAFFKFAWSFRLFNYVIVMIGATPGAEAGEAALDRYADKLAKLHTLGAMHFTMGINAYFFALAAGGWFLNPWLFMVATLWVSLVLYRRAFRSRFLRILQE